VARPLREQFALATLVLLIPVSVVMTWSAGLTYETQISELNREAQRLATAIAKHIEQMGPGQDDRIDSYLRAMRVEQGTTLRVVRDSDSATAATYSNSTEQNIEELTSASAPVEGRGLTVFVGIPNQVAWWRSGPLYKRTIAISGIATLILLGMEMVFIRRWLPALTHLERTADRVGAGDLTMLPRDPMPSRELEHLRDAFGDMVDRLRTARQAIAEQFEEERRMRQEVESLQQQVIRQERLAAIGTLLSGIAHELNNPLQAIAGFSEILQRDPDLKESVVSDLGLIKKESARASAIIRNLSRFSRQQGSTPALVRVADVVASVVELRRRRLQDQGVQLDLDLQATRPVMAVFTELQQVLLNFLVNAEQSVAVQPPGPRRLAIRTRDTDAGLHLEVEDNGPGVPAEHEAKLFQPFFTTKPIGEGTGLGLSVSYGIVRSFGGTMGYRRGEMGGALFFVDLPAAPATQSA
jgi:C4-dicarboxylate-specific signal transduction histidine kinase